ncbi:YdeI/OmpD-associated family protein [Paenibacillus sp. HN-1]|uniref:YdeI/OmpD-associated family protein n=1 Tax=Paenibacillus TaxID=44249 RepID=UPI001CA9403C|nr:MULTISPECIES: YdeI/OmpD-associated family protein [Paenibacillus]MBY9080277.1 YdeI/OmpD-associated family protein [Paenibacillus sp. CGMCC 1.18879]MBY9083064.1 YdeI/OmpD-associated family protein [Paenibacillus sinensis]
MDARNTVVAKLNLHKYPDKLILNMPEGAGYFEGLEFDSAYTRGRYDLIFIFVFHLDQLKDELQSVIAKQAIQDGGYVYFAYPKKNNPRYKDYIERDSLLPALSTDEDGYVPGSTLKFSRMVSLDEVFTVVGLKSQAKAAGKKEASRSSQRVEDYIARIPDIERYLESDPEALKLYSGLTPGYRKDWARYVYSAKRQETQEKRLAEMKEILGQGYKTVELYRQRPEARG